MSEHRSASCGAALPQPYLCGLRSRNLTIGGRRTSLRLEPSMWDALEEIGLREGLTLPQLCEAAQQLRAGRCSLTSVLRSMTVTYFRDLLPGTRCPLCGRSWPER
ncbi:MAG: ribbon-helix-helix domain-containing protein [Dongiaceae bacterium]